MSNTILKYVPAEATQLHLRYWDGTIEVQYIGYG